MADLPGHREPQEHPMQEHPVRPAPLGAAEVLAYLRHHPEFLAEHAELLEVMSPPERRQGDNVLDLQHLMLQRLRDELARVKGQQRALIFTSRSNLTSQQRIHEAVLNLIGATSFEQLLQVVTIDLTVTLDIDVVTLCIESGGDLRPPVAGVQLLRPGEVDHLLGPGGEALLEDHVRGDPALFGSGAGLVRSEALLRLSVPGAPPGLMAMGSRKPSKFKPGQGTELLSFLARALSVTIAQWLDL